MSKQMELKAYQMLADIRGNMLNQIQHEAKLKAEYCKDKPEDLLEWWEYVANPAKWGYCGLLSEKDKAVLETIEYLLDDNASEIRRYKEWKPNK